MPSRSVIAAESVLDRVVICVDLAFAAFASVS